jgi:hypothetical protein
MRGRGLFVPWLVVVLCLSVELARGQESPSPTQEPAPVVRAPAVDVQQAQEMPLPPPPPYDKSIFQRTIPAGELDFLKQMGGKPSGDVWKDKQFHKVVRSAIPNPMFHYGSDMAVEDAMDKVMTRSPEPVLVRDGRYVVVSGKMGPYLSGRGMVWVDTQDGVVLSAFYFHPTNGEPTPTVTVFTKQIKTDTIEMSQLPPEFAVDLALWSQEMRVPAAGVRYFIGDGHKKILLAHDEDYCVGAGPAEKDACEHWNADAADADMVAASYLEQTHYATNATEWMITGSDQTAWLQVRERTCGAVLDPLGCRIGMTRERTRVIMHQPPMRSGPSAPHPPQHVGR